MASELELAVALRWLSGELDIRLDYGPKFFDVAGEVMKDIVQEVGTSEELLDVTGVTLGGYCFLQNLDDTNYVSLLPDTGLDPAMTLYPGGIAMFRTVAATTPYVIANTLAVNLRVILIAA